jgi:hypothetical protein
MNVTMLDQNGKIGRMLQLRTELVSLIEWEEENFDYPTQTEIDAVAHHSYGGTAQADA